METTEGLITSNTTAEAAENAIDSTPFPTVVKILMVLAIVLNLVLNPLMLFTLRRVTSIQPTTKVFMISLTLSDLYYSLGRMLDLTALFSDHWFLGDFLCTASVVMNGAAIELSIGALLLLTVDRYIAISRPLHYPSVITEFRSKVAVCITWTSINIISILLFGINSRAHIKHVGINRSICIFTADWRFRIGAVLSCVPILAIFILYAHITLIARNQARRIAAENQAGNGRGGQRMNTRSTTTIIIITGTLIITWMPTVVWIVILFQKKWEAYESYNFFKFTQVLLLSNGWLNAVIYYLRNRDLRQTLCGLLSDWWQSLFQRK